MATGMAEAKPQQHTLRTLIESDAIKVKMASMLPKHVTADRMIRVVVGAINKNPKLATCTQESFLECLMQLSQWGLEPDGRRAHLIPYENKKTRTTTCTLVVDYKGVAELVMRSGMVSSIHADVVCENDEFVYDLGQVQRHKIDFRNARGAIYAVWCRIAFTNGGEKHEVMTASEVNTIRDKSQGYRSAMDYRKDHPWISHWSEMAKKTVFKRCAKWAPWSAEIRAAIDADDDDYRTVDASPTKIEVQTLADVAKLAAPQEEAGPAFDTTEFLADLSAAKTADEVDGVEAKWSATLPDGDVRLADVAGECDAARARIGGGK